MKNPAASALGKLAAGKPKNYSPDELERRRKLMNKINDLRKRRIKLEKSTAAALKRWAGHKKEK